MPAPEWLHDALELLFKPVLYEIDEVSKRISALETIVADNLSRLDSRLETLLRGIDEAAPATADALEALDGALIDLGKRVGRLELAAKV